MLKKTIVLLFIVINFFTVFGQIPVGYYNTAASKSGAELKTALYNIIKGHTTLTYDDLWTAYRTTDIKPNGKVWDMYSDKPGATPAYEFTFSTSQCGNYSGEGSCYNREHSFPKSWFADASPMVSDLFHIVPTDGYVNGQRSNYPFGEVAAPTFTSTNGSKLGPCAFPGYSGIVFEPIDEYKGDFARIYFYMATRYENLIANWTAEVLDGTAFPAYKPWVINLLMKWNNQDPVSQKEITRNEAAFKLQKNRNPFVDHPEYSSLVWSNGVKALTFTSSPILSANEGQTYTYNITAAGESETALTIRSANTPTWLAFTDLGSGKAKLTGIPTPNNIGKNDISLSLSDGKTVVNQSFQINVVAKPTGITFTSFPIVDAKENTLYQYSITAIDNDNPSKPVTFTCSTKPNWLTLADNQNNTAYLSGTPAKSDVGNNKLVITASNTTLTADQTFTVNVAAADLIANGLETFENMPSASSAYSTFSYLGNSGVNWNATLGRTDLSINQRAICLRKDATAKLESDSIAGGCGSVSFSTKQMYATVGGAITLYINETKIGQPAIVSVDQTTATFNNININGKFKLKLISNGATQIGIDDIAWTNYSAPTTNYEEIDKFSVVGIYPNPFSEELFLGFEITRTGKFTLEIYNQTGKLLSQIEKTEQTPGYHEINLSDNSDIKSSKGMLIFRIITANKTIVKKVFRY